MKRKVRITKLPQYKGGGAYRTFGTHTPPQDNTVTPGKGFNDNRSTPEIKVNRTLKPIPREQATLEAEKGETVVTSLNKDGIPEFYDIAGKPHSRGGTPLNLPPESFIYSRDKSLGIKNPIIKRYFGKTDKSNKLVTPAELSRNFNLNHYRQILADPNTDKLQKETAEMMIKNYNHKLGALALVQEAKKGFEGGIPSISQSFIQTLGIQAADLIGPQSAPGQEVVEAMYGGEYKLGGAVKSLPKFNNGGKYNEGDIRLKPGETVIFMPSTRRYAIINKEGEITGYINTSPNNLSGTENDPNTRSNPVESSVPTKAQNIPNNVTKHDITSKDYDPNKVKEGDYIKKNGRWYRVKGRKASVYEGTPIDELDERLKGDAGDLREAYGRLEYAIRNNQELQDDLYNKYIEEMEKAKDNGLVGQKEIDYAKGLSKKQVIDNYLSHEKDIFIINANKGNIGAADKNDTWDKGLDSKTGLPRKYVETANELGLDLKSVEDTFAFQVAYIGMQGLVDDPKHKDFFDQYEMPKHGRGDESKDIYKGQTISDADGWWGNTTVGQAQLWADKSKELDLEEVAETKLETEDELEHMPQGIDYEPETPYWTQDLRNIGLSAYGMMNVRKGEPFRGKPFYGELPPATADFRGAAARLQADAEGGRDFLEGYADANAGRTAYLNSQKNLVAGITALQDQEYKTNLPIINSWRARHEAGRNPYAKDLHTVSKTNWDENERANQQFANEKMGWLNQFIKAVNDADTNRGYTQNMNATKDDWYVDPRDGKLKRKWWNVRPINPTIPNNQTAYDLAKTYKYENPEMTWTDARALATADLKQTTAPAENQFIDPSAYTYPGGIPG
jgi:hypothetical protein